MTVRGDLERAIAMAAAAKGNYLLFATESQDETVQNVFNDMADDMERHTTILVSRREYLDEHNELNQMIAQEGEGAAKDKDKEQKKSGKQKSGQQGH